MRTIDRALVKALPVVPRRVVQRVSARYIAGPSVADARRTVARLNAEGKMATIDVLGEEVRSPQEAEAIARSYHAVLEAIDADRLDANVSVKLTALGLHLDLDTCRRLLAAVVEDAASRGTFVRIDMEDSSCTDVTLRLYRELRESGRENVGIVLQSRLRRSLDDVAALADLRPNVRLCKGIYLEPEAIAYRDPDEIRASFLRLLDALVEGGSYVALATHDEELIARSLERVAGMRPSDYELQFLLGVRGARASELVAAGHRLRVYVPYGERWYEYSLRRLQENPELASTIARATLGRLLPRRG